MSWWNLSVMKSVTEQRDDQNPNLQSTFSPRYQWCWSSKTMCLTQTVQKKAWGSSLHGCMNWHSLHHSLLDFASHKKARLNLLLLVFFFWGYHSHLYLIQKRVSLWSLCFWYLIIIFIFRLFIIDYLNFTFLTCWYRFISFFSFEYFSFITLCSFQCVFFRDFYFLFRIEERVLK